MFAIDTCSNRASAARWPAILAAILPLVVALCTTGADAAVRPVTAVVLAGQVAPGTGGQTFNGNFDEPMVNTAGDVVFTGDYNAGAGRGVFLSRGGALTAIAVGGQVIPGVGTLAANNFFDGPAFNNKSTVIFVTSNITAGPATDALLQKTVIGSLTVIAKNGDAIPDIPSGVFISFDDMALNNGDDVAFVAHYTDDGGVTTKSGVFLKPTGGPVQTIVKDGDVLPNTGGGTLCSSGDPDGPWINDSKVVTFIADCITGAPNGSMFARRPGFALESFILDGDAAPPAIGGTIVSGQLAAGRPGLTNANVTGVYSEFSPANGNALLTKTLGTATSSATICSRSGVAAPGTAGTVSEFGAPAINQSGMLASQVNVTGDVNVTNGIFSCAGGVLSAVSLQGDPKPGGTPGELFTSGQSDQSLSDNGRVVFIDNGGTTPGVWISAAQSKVVIPTLSEWGLLLMALVIGGVGVFGIRHSRRVQA